MPRRTLVGQVGGSAEIEAVKPEAVSVAACQVKNVVRFETAGKASMFEGMVQVVMRVVLSALLSGQGAIGLNVRRLRVPRLIGTLPHLQPGVCCGRSGPAFRGSGWISKREHERSAASGLRLHPDSSAVSLDDVLADGKSHAGAGDFHAMQSLERDKDGFVVLFGHTDAVVQNENQGFAAAALLRADRNGEAGIWTTIIDSVGQQTLNHLLKGGEVAKYAWERV